MEGKNVLIIGASSGIGLATARQLVQSGNRVYTASRQESDELKSLTTHFQSFDVLTDELDMTQLSDTLHALVYCPGTINLKPFHRIKQEEFVYDFQLNVLGAIKVIQANLKALKKAKGASIVLFSTVASQLGMSFHSSIAMAKGAIEGLAKSLAAELALAQIRVNVVAPSLTDTPLASKLLSTEEKRVAGAKRHPLNRIGKSEDMANAVQFLLSEKSDWMTGQILAVDGGLSSVKLL